MAAGSRIKVVFDDLTDAVSVFVIGTRSARVRPSPNDPRMLLEFDSCNVVVGVDVLGASVLVPSAWQQHPDRALIPRDILRELDSWLAHRWADIGRTG